ncbi:bifunctional hydroxymethylpyrimidine kinase/phosphomethylpyrimidine kinase [Lichenihabitans psoromatis]|uniref:bifunctional hydroxymethylpyrimidine kinase/phosphomethylpyrimidine kinase n=1 Tax=Lichenihabitans psoromatis TaxID=2528642 RepID=UPI0013F154A7|nr:bifunctional hydroxymethylpyrimidine kinase/phosphomethylpyrimidine kinase [Lichenihabitans psoromatis]
MIPNLLSIAGSDPSGGAGIQADLKTFSALGCYGMAALTALTAQNTRGVSGVHVVPPEFVAAEIDAIFADISVDAVKLGMLADGAVVAAVTDRLVRHAAGNIVLDPVLVATSGDSLGSPDVVGAMTRLLLPLATLVTPNLPEAARLADGSVPTDVTGMRLLAEKLVASGARAVLVKGGHLDGDVAVDILFDGTTMREFSAPRIDTPNTHGTGCTLSSAIAAYLALGDDLAGAVTKAKAFLTDALRTSGELRVGGGHGPVHHFHSRWNRSAEP